MQYPSPVQDPVKAQEPLATEEINQPFQRMVRADHVASDHVENHEHDDHKQHEQDREEDHDSLLDDEHHD